MFPNKIKAIMIIVTTSFSVIEENNPPKIVQNATKVPLKSTEFKSSVKKGLSFACFQSITNRIIKTAIDFDSSDTTVYPIRKIMNAFR